MGWASGMKRSDWFWLKAIALMFIWLKLAGHLDWSWWWILIPTYAAMVLAMPPATERVNYRRLWRKTDWSQYQ